MDEIDIDALKRCLAATRAEDPGRRAQIDSMLADQNRSWESVAVFAASCAQSRSLGLQPWQSPPFRASLRDLDKRYGGASGKRESAELPSVCAIPAYRYSSPIHWLRLRSARQRSKGAEVYKQRLL